MIARKNTIVGFNPIRCRERHIFGLLASAREMSQQKFRKNVKSENRPLFGRWLSRDPIGYSDGMNLYGYVGNAPINNVDPTGQLSWHDKPPVNFTQLARCGNFVWITGWDLDSSERTGWIVQHIFFRISVKTCDQKTVIQDELNPDFHPDPDEYWEAWQVTNGMFLDNNAPNNDKLSIGHKPIGRGRDTCGSFDVIAEAVFYTGNEPMSWPANSIKAAGALRATTSEPSFWASLAATYPKPANRYVHQKWRCCPEIHSECKYGLPDMDCPEPP